MDVPLSSGQCIEIDHSTVAVLVNYPNVAYLTGILNVKAVRGTIQIFGYNLIPNVPAVPVYSIKELSTLTVFPVNDGNIAYDGSYLKSLNTSSDRIDEIENKSLCYSHLFVVTKDKEFGSFVSFFRNNNIPLFTTESDDFRMVQLSWEDKGTVFMKREEWDQLAEKFLNSPRKVVICGGKNVGKSTFIRYLANRILSKSPRILVIDFDPGQSEFTVMGCVSAVLVERPLLGPNFTHFMTPERCFYVGDISVNTCFGLYCESVKKLVNFSNSSEYQNIPWVINTMGFVKGLGIRLSGLIINSIQPTDIIQIKSDNNENNFPGPLTPEFFKEQNFDQDTSYDWNSNLHIIPSVAEESAKLYNRISIIVREPAVKRNIVLMSYFKKALKGQDTDLLSIVPQKIKIDNVKIVVIKPTSKEMEMTMPVIEKLCCINANLVALCRYENVNEVHCLGFGIVRGIDLESKYIYISTPLSQDVFQEVTVIKFSSGVELPQSFYKDQVSMMNGPCPYVSYKKLSTLHQQIRKTSGRVKR